MPIQQMLDSIHHRNIISNFIFYALNVAIPIQLAVNVHTQTFCNVNYFSINNVYANYWIIEKIICFLLITTKLVFDTCDFIWQNCTFTT